MKCPCEYDARRFFLFGMRVFFGVWLLNTGLTKWVKFGTGPFVGMITKEFDRPATWSPHPLNVFLAWVILIAEPVLGLLILSGLKPRMIWGLTALLMFMLLMGQSLLMKGDVFSNWGYTVLTLVCAALSEPELKAQMNADARG
jgi:uncharacterized membrane protein YphA (DoxX/SURF4 family)